MQLTFPTHQPQESAHVTFVPLVCSQRTDMGLWTDQVALWARCLASSDIEDKESTAYTCMEATTSLIVRIMRLKVGVLPHLSPSGRASTLLFQCSLAASHSTPVWVWFVARQTILCGQFL